MNASPPTRATPGSTRVLLLEDTPDDAALVLRELRRVLPDAEVRHVESGEAFRAALEEFRPDLVLSDHGLKEFSGMHALELMRRDHPETPFVFVTGSLDEETAAACVKAGAWDYVLKDRLVRLGPAVDAALELRRTREALRRSQEQLLHTQKMDALGRLAGGVAHDYNNLTTAILGYTQFVFETMEAGDPRCADLEEIRLAAERATGLSQQLLAFSRKQLIQLKPVDLNGLIEGTERLLARLIGEHITVVTRLGDALPRVHSDPGQLEQVIVNLALNARDAMPQGGTLTIQTEAVVLDGVYVALHPDAGVGPHVRLTCRDTGIGMDAATLARLFEPFFTTKPRGQGTGLGLATVYGIVRQSNGHITVSSAMGRGSTFAVCVPVAKDAPDALAVTATSRPDTLAGTETILVAEDDAAVRALAARVLRSYGYTILEAATTDEALSHSTRPGGIDLLLTDLVMPGPSGHALAAALAERLPALRVVYMSGYTDDEIARLHPRQRRGRFLQKPFSPRVLAEMVREALDETPRDSG